MTLARTIRRIDLGGGPRGGRAGRAFTLVEMLVVITIIVILLLIALPAFSSLLYSSESSMADGLLRTALRSGRDAALRSTGDADAAVVFFYEPGGRLTMITCVKVGQFDDMDAGSPVPVRREIFVPSADFEPVQLPRNWMVRGYAPPNSIQPAGTWYEGDHYGQDLTRGDWVFPETGFYDQNQQLDQSRRQTFMVRYEAGTGIMSTASLKPVLVLAPRPSDAGRDGPAWQNPNRTLDYRRYVQRILTTPLTPQFTAADRRALLGDESSDTVLTRAVAQIALYDETKLAAGIGAQIDRTTGCLYQAPTAGNNYMPTFVIVGGYSPAVVAARMNQWIEGDTNFNGVMDRRDSAYPDTPEARIFTIDRYTAALLEVEVQR